MHTSTTMYKLTLAYEFIWHRSDLAYGRIFLNRLISDISCTHDTHYYSFSFCVLMCERLFRCEIRNDSDISAFADGISQILPLGLIPEGLAILFLHKRMNESLENIGFNNREVSWMYSECSEIIATISSVNSFWPTWNCGLQNWIFP